VQVNIIEDHQIVPTTLSVITAVADPAVPFIDQTWESLVSIQLPDNWQLQWCVQSDAATSDLTTHEWATDPRVSLGTNLRPSGAGAARNNALLRARGAFVISVDADDLVASDLLEVLLPPFDDESVGWVGAGWLELPVEEARRNRFIPADPGPKERGWLGRQIADSGTTPFQMNSILYRRQALISSGGWPAFSEWEDTIVAVKVSGLWAGYVDDRIIGRYRRHPGQTVNSARFKDPELRATMIDYVCSVAAATEAAIGLQ